MGVFAAILLGSGLVYAFAIGSFAVGFRRVMRAEVETSSEPFPFVTVIVPARDEAASIVACLDSIFAGDYPEDRFDVLVVDDLSRDATPDLVRRTMQRYNRIAVPAGFEEEDDAPRLRLIPMPENEDRARAHKKRAIEKGIEHARGEIILTTDADCIVPPRWIRRMTAPFDAETALVSGPVLYPTGGPAADVAALEFLGLVAVGAGAIGIGRPNLCNGANVAYRKAVFHDLGGFSGIDHLTSGDDELLMQKIAYTTDWRVRFCPAPDAAVLTAAPDGSARLLRAAPAMGLEGRALPAPRAPRPHRSDLHVLRRAPRRPARPPVRAGPRAPAAGGLRAQNDPRGGAPRRRPAATSAGAG